MFKRKIHSGLALVSLLSLLMCIFMFYLWITYDGVPAKKQLTQISGNVIYFHNSSKGGSTFELNTSDKTFLYHIGKEHGKVNQALAAALKSTKELSQPTLVTVLFSPTDTHSNIITRRKSFHIYELKSNDKMVRSYRQMKQDFDDNNAWTPLLIIIFLIVSLYLGVLSTNKQYIPYN